MRGSGRRFFGRRLVIRGAVAGALVLLGGCSDDGTSPGSPDTGRDLSCNVPTSQIFSGGVGRDGIPSLSEPRWTEPGAPDASYLAARDRVLGLVVDGQAWAVPHNILWWHEIANIEIGDRRLAVTYCPLTGSTMAFDRASLGGAELGVSGLLFNNNLMMFDREDRETLYPQMAARATCGPRTGRSLTQVPILEITWAGWQELHPDTRVLSSEQGFTRDYRLYPYGEYEGRAGFLFPMPFLDFSRHPKERVLGLRDGDDGGRAFPFGALEARGAWAAVPTEHRGEAAVILWSTEHRAAAAFRPRADGDPLTLEARPDGIFDRETGSRWSVEGRAVEGPLAGQSLEQIPEGYVAFWGAWAVFQPETELWSG